MRTRRIKSKPKLAVFGASLAFKRPLYAGAPIIEGQLKQRYFDYMEQVFRRNYFTNNGPLVQELEKRIAQIHNVKHCVAVCNATIALMLILKALDLRGEVILPSFTFIATAHACIWQGLKPVFCDIYSDNLTINSEELEKLINKKTSAIIGVHLFGNICKVRKLERLARDYNLKLVFDAAHAFGCSLGNRSIGGFGNAEVLSFHATKFFSTFEGGAIITNDAKIAQRAKLLRNFGFTGYDKVGFMGINAKMSESSAAMGLASFPEIRSRMTKLKKIYLMYRKNLSLIPGVRLVSIGRDGMANYQYVPILIDKDRFGVSRDVLYRVLWKENVIARRYFYPGCHKMEPYRSLYGNISERLPVSEDVARKILCLPTDFSSPLKEISKIRNIITAVHENSGKILKWAKNQI